jgi:hypothetical protein
LTFSTVRYGYHWLSTTDLNPTDRQGKDRKGKEKKISLNAWLVHHQRVMIKELNRRIREARKESPERELKR